MKYKFYNYFNFKIGIGAWLSIVFISLPVPLPRSEEKGSNDFLGCTKFPRLFIGDSSDPKIYEEINIVKFPVKEN